jgi:hypothetical protein
MATRSENERTYQNWIDDRDGNRKYWYDVEGKHGRKARYVKIVDSGERTLQFFQEIYDPSGELVEIHEKYPVDKGHRTIGK